MRKNRYSLSAGQPTYVRPEGKVRIVCPKSSILMAWWVKDKVNRHSSSCTHLEGTWRHLLYGITQCYMPATQHKWRRMHKRCCCAIMYRRSTSSKVKSAGQPQDEQAPGAYDYEMISVGNSPPVYTTIQSESSAPAEYMIPQTWSPVLTMNWHI